MQVTFRVTPLGGASIFKVLVVTGAEEAGGGYVQGGAYSSTTGTAWNVTPTQADSLVLFGVSIVASAWPAGASTPRANNAFIELNAVGNGQIIGYYSGPVNPPTAAPVGHAGSAVWAGCGGYELRRSGAARPALDPSAPPRLALPSNALVTTANFNPPPGSVLVIVAPFGTSGTPVITLTDTTGLTWTQRAFFNTSWQGGCAVYTASVPGPAGPPAQAWDGTAWVPGRVRGWDGSRWAPARAWDGQQWRSLAG